jgi:aminoglycoside phosphotransferase (APT) family kinase protein
METTAEAPSTVAGLNLAALVPWLQPRLPGFEADVDVQRIDGGQSNPSWILRGADQAWVLRAKPAPKAALMPSAHAIEREYTVMQALQNSDVPVPRMRVLCEDESVIGVAFYVMDFVEGRILRDATLPGVPTTERAAHYLEASRVLAALHRVDWQAVGLQDFGRADGYFGRLIHRWTKQYRQGCNTEVDGPAGGAQYPIAAMEQLAAWLPAHIPAGADDRAHTCITHGDFRLENMIFHPTEPRVVAVLDWELSTLGHPLSDLAYNCLAWHMPKGILRGYADQDLAALGIPSELDYVRHYCAQTNGQRGLDSTAVLRDWPFYLAFNLFRLAAILHGIGVRERAGTASSASAHEISAMAEPVAQWGWAIAQGKAPTY